MSSNDNQVRQINDLILYLKTLNNINAFRIAVLLKSYKNQLFLFDQNMTKLTVVSHINLELAKRQIPKKKFYKPNQVKIQSVNPEL